MTRVLTESRKADRAEMARQVAALCAELGADCAIAPEHDRCLRVEITVGNARVGIDFDGSPYNGNREVFCMPWNIGDDRTAQFSPAFGHAVGDSVNPYHRRKCMGFAHGFDNLLLRLRSAIECINSGGAFLVKEQDG